MANDERDPGTDGNERDPAPLEALLRRATEPVPAALDRRIAALSAPAATVRDAASLPPPPRRGWRRVAIAAGLLCLGGLAFAVADPLGWFRGDASSHPIANPSMPPTDVAAQAPPPAVVAPAAERTAAPAVDPVDRVAPPTATTSLAATSAAEDDDADPPEPDSWSSGFPRNVHARATFEQAPFVARLRTVATRTVPGRAGGQPASRPIARIEHVYSGDRTLVGRQIELHRHVGPSSRSFLAWSEHPAHVDRFPWVTAFALIDKPALPDGTLHAQQLLAEGYGATLLAESAALASGTTPRDRDEEIAELLHDLASSLDESRIGESAVTALRQFDGDESPLPSSDSAVWRDPIARDALLAAAGNRNPKMRWTIAWMNPAAAGAEGCSVLLDLLFDEDATVRQPAAHWLTTLGDVAAARGDGSDELRSGFAALRAELVARGEGDCRFDELIAQINWTDRGLLDSSRLAAHLEQLAATRDPEQRVRALSQLQDVRDPAAIAAVEACLADPDVAVRRTALWTLASMGDATVVDRLQEIPEHEDARVRVMAGYAQLRLGDARGAERLQRLLASDDAQARDQVVRLLDRLLGSEGSLLALPLLFQATRHADSLVRSSALVTLGRRGGSGVESSEEVQRITAELAAAAADPSPAVRAAAAAARRAWQRATQRSEAIRLSSRMPDDADDGN